MATLWICDESYYSHLFLQLVLYQVVLQQCWDREVALEIALWSYGSGRGNVFGRKASVQISIYKVFKKKQNFTCEMKDNILQTSTSDLPTSTQLHKVLNPIRK